MFSENGPSDWTVYPGGTYRALKNYLQLVQPHYNAVVQEIANELSVMRRIYPSLPQDVGDSFIVWATGRFDQAIALINNHIGNTVGFYADWYEINGPS